MTTRYHSKRIDNPRYPPLANAILSIAKLHPAIENPMRVIDFGSSCGALLKVLNDYQDWNMLVGLDHSKDAGELWCCDGEFILDDFNIKLEESPINKSLNNQFDLIICQEVAEHLDPDNFGDHWSQSNDPLTDRFKAAAANSATLVFGAAPPGQRGRGHINCRPHSYWMKKIEGRTWQYNHKMTVYFAYILGTANNPEPIVPQYYLNTMIFTKNAQ